MFARARRAWLFCALALIGSKLRSGSGDHPIRSAPALAKRSGRRRRPFPFALLLFLLFFAAAAEFGLIFAAAAQDGHLDITNTGRAMTALKDQVVAALTDPFALLDRRSPGRRRAGILHNTKTATLPHERVLAGIRQRDIPPGFLAPPQAGPALADHSAASDENGPSIFAPPPNAVSDVSPAVTFSPAGGSLVLGSMDSPLGLPGFFTNPFVGPFASNIPPGGPGTSNPPGGPGITDSPPPAGPEITPDIPGPDTPPGTCCGTGTPPGPPDTPPGTCCGPDTPPGPPDTPPATTLAEPASWTLMILGLVVLARMRRKQRRRNA